MPHTSARALPFLHIKLQPCHGRSGKIVAAAGSKTGNNMSAIWKRATLCIVCGLMVYPAGAPAQRRDRRAAVARPSPEPDAPIRSNVNLTILPVTVFDESTGRIVNGLQREQFTVLEDRKPQRIATFSADDAPCSIGLLFDNSGSMERKIESARVAMAHLVEVLNPEDEVFLMTFADRPEPPGEFTSDFADLQNTVLFAKPSGQTALIDALYQGVQQMRAARHPRRAIVVISDGGDNNSRYGSRELLDYAMEADVQIHALGVKPLPYGTFLLDAIASATGGLSITIDKLKALDDAMNTIGLALHNQYLIGYYPPEKPRGAKWRKVQVKVTPDDGRRRLRAYTRSGYFGPE